jgi:DNA-binding MltR family transcriptional regulator
MPAETLSEDSQRFYDVLNDEPDHSAIIIGVSYLDACLGAMLEKFLIEGSTSKNFLDPRRGALGTFSARSDACYVLGMISKIIYQDLLTLAELRNHCAHHHLLQSFSDPDVSARCQKLSYAEALFQHNGIYKGMFAEIQLADPRTRFTLTAAMISQRLLVDALSTPRRPARTGLP